MIAARFTSDKIPEQAALTKRLEVTLEICKRPTGQLKNRKKVTC